MGCVQAKPAPQGAPAATPGAATSVAAAAAAAAAAAGAAGIQGPCPPDGSPKCLQQTTVEAAAPRIGAAAIHVATKQQAHVQWYSSDACPNSTHAAAAGAKAPTAATADRSGQPGTTKAACDSACSLLMSPALPPCATRSHSGSSSRSCGSGSCGDAAGGSSTERPQLPPKQAPQWVPLCSPPPSNLLRLGALTAAPSPPPGAGAYTADAAAITAAAAAAAGMVAAAAAAGPLAVNPAALAQQLEVLRAHKASRLAARRGGGQNCSLRDMQALLSTSAPRLARVNTRAAGIKHIGFGPLKKENQDELFIEVGHVGGDDGCNLFAVFDGHGTHGKDAATFSRQVLPRLLDWEVRKHLSRVQGRQEGLQGAVEMLLGEVFAETERTLSTAGINLSSSGTTASVAYQRGNQVWVAAVGDSRVVLCGRRPQGGWRVLPMTIDHRPRRQSERQRVEAAGGRIAPKQLPSGRTIGEPRLWLQHAPSPGLLLSRSLGDLRAAAVGCTCEPEITYATLQPGVDCFLVLATDGVWDVLTNEQVCDIVVESPDPHIACRRVLDAALHEWEERMSADNVTVVVVEFDWSANSQECSPPTGAALECELPCRPSPTAIAAAAGTGAWPSPAAPAVPAADTAAPAPTAVKAAGTPTAAAAAGVGGHHNGAHLPAQDVWHLGAAGSEQVQLSLANEMVSHEDTASAVFQPRSLKTGSPGLNRLHPPVVITPAAAAGAAAATQGGAQL